MKNILMICCILCTLRYCVQFCVYGELSIQADLVAFCLSWKRNWKHKMLQFYSVGLIYFDGNFLLKYAFPSCPRKMLCAALEPYKQCLPTLLEKKCFLIANLNLPWHSLRPLPLVLSLLLGEEADPISLQPPVREL